MGSNELLFVVLPNTLHYVLFRVGSRQAVPKLTYICLYLFSVAVNILLVPSDSFEQNLFTEALQEQEIFKSGHVMGLLLR